MNRIHSRTKFVRGQKVQVLTEDDAVAGYTWKDAEIFGIMGEDVFVRLEGGNLRRMKPHEWQQGLKVADERK